MRPDLALWPYQAEHSVELVALTVLPVAAVFAVFDGAQVVLFGVLRGVGDTFLPALANLIGCYLLGVPLGLYLAFTWEWGPLGIWCGLATALAIVAHLLVLRLAVTARRVERYSVDGMVCLGVPVHTLWRIFIFFFLCLASVAHAGDAWPQYSGSPEAGGPRCSGSGYQCPRPGDSLESVVSAQQAFFQTRSVAEAFQNTAP